MAQDHGRIIALPQMRSGVSPRTGEQWANQQIVIEIDGRYTRRVSADLFGWDKIQAANLQLGQYVTLKYEVEAREFEGRWYNDVRVYDIERDGRSVLRISAPTQPQAQISQPQQPQHQGYAPANVNNYAMQSDPYQPYGTQPQGAQAPNNNIPFPPTQPPY